MRISMRTFLSRSLAIAGLGFVAAGCLMLRCSPLYGEDFQPIKEAEMPKGFPAYTPVGKVEIKKYPAYRKASASGAAEFWTLFEHIKQNHIEMSAPVEMDYGDAKAEKNGERTMSFLYGSKEQGKTGKQGSVLVSDVPEMTVASIGCRGSRSTKAIAAAKTKLVKFLEAEGSTYEISGPLRVMGYNSPFVPRDKNFFEVQIPVKVKKT